MFEKLSQVWHKRFLLIVSLGLVGLFSQSLVTPAFVLALLTISFFSLSGVTDKPSKRRVLLIVNWTVLPIGFFLMQSHGWVGVLSGETFVSSTSTTLLLGLPFYILSVLSINTEVQTGRMLRPSWLDYVLYSAYFPKFLSGPVEHPVFLQKLSNFRFTYSAQRWASGFDWVVLGMFCKFVVAHYVSKNVDWTELRDLSKILLSISAFELQVYFDLGGYSFMAFGISKMLGLDLTLNFNHPFFAGNIRSFWQRWHITLGRWFFHYVYTPIRSLDPASALLKFSLPLLIFLLSAVWHGQTLNFLVWGLWHGFAYLAYVTVFSRYKWPSFLGLPMLLLVLVIGRLLFMESTFPYLLLKVAQLLSIDAWRGMFSVLRNLKFDIRDPACFDLLTAAVLAFGFLWLEFRNQRASMSPYGIFMRPSVQWIMIILGLLLLEGNPTGFIYARQ